MKFLSLFAGIGGFDLGLERAGMECVGQVEIDPYCLAVLKKHWPNVKRIDDIRKVRGDEFGAAELICGGFPCQPFSLAGKRAGAEDDRYLWPEMCRIVKTLRPAWVLGENVAGIVGVELDKVHSDLESIGYTVQSFIIPACAVDAPHRRRRVWIVCYSECRMRNRRADEPWRGSEERTSSCGSSEALAHAEIGAERAGLCAGEPGRIWRGRFGDGSSTNDVADADSDGTIRDQSSDGQGGGIVKDGRWLPEPGVGRVVNGVPGRVDRLRSLGNAVVPQIVEEIGRCIIETERTGTICAGRAAAGE